MHDSPDSQALRTLGEWIDAALETPAGPRWRRLSGPPLSFRYGAALASALLPAWDAAIEAPRDDADGRRVVARFVDPVSQVGVEYTCRRLGDAPAIDISMTVTNHGTADSLPLAALRPLDLSLAAEDGPLTLHTFRGGGLAADAYAPLAESLDAGTRLVFGGQGGRSSGAHLPWLNLQGPRGGLLAIVGWSGQWQAEVSRADGLVTLRAGLSDLDAVLRPGESLRAPRIVLLAWDGDTPIDGFNRGRRLFLDHVAPKAHGRPIAPPVAKLTPYDELDLATWTSHHGEDNQMAAIAEAAALGLEAYWLDAYWFDGYYPRGLGNWQFPVERTVRASFPRGLRPLADAAHAAGLQFILWFAPETFSSDTYVDRHLPAWTLRTDGVDGGLFNLALPEARDWMTRFIVDSLRTFGADVCRMDLTREPLDFWRAADQPNRRGMTEVRFIEGVYDLWDRIREALPGVWMDNCAGGGQRIDLETCSRALVLWRSDFNDTPERRQGEIGAIADQAMIMGLSHCLPFHGGPVWRPEPYYWRSALAAGMNLYWDLRPDKATGAYAYDRALTRQAIAEYKSLRHCFEGDYYPLTPITTDARVWAAYEYVLPDGHGFAMFFRRPEASSDRLAVRLRGLQPDRQYRVEWRSGYALDDSRIMRGADLGTLEATIAAAPGSLLVRFSPV